MRHAAGRRLWICAAVLVMCSGAVVWAADKPVDARVAAEQANATDNWAVRLVPGADIAAIARVLGADHYQQVGTLPNTYVLHLPNSRWRVPETQAALSQIAAIRWFEQQIARPLKGLQTPSDPLYHDQWYLKNTGQTGCAGNCVDIDVAPAWTSGYTGSGVLIGVVDNGVQYTHPDLLQNYDAPASWDFNDNDPDPAPRLVGGCEDTADCHGTSVAGVVAAASNATCGVGVAFNAAVAGLRLTAGLVEDTTIATALTYAQDRIAIYNNSWSPGENGIVQDRNLIAGPPYVFNTSTDQPSIEALEQGATNGRNQLGSIYVWAAGNGRGDHDNVNYNGYANSRFAITVGAVDHVGVQTSFSDPGAALLLVAPSGTLLEPVPPQSITTIDLLGAAGYDSAGDCTNRLGGTSSTAPIVSGVIALMLQANPNLTWRDVQHILVNTAVKNQCDDPTDPNDETWYTNAAGLRHSHKCGFGLVDAKAAVNAALSWPNVAPAVQLASGVVNVGQAVPDFDVVNGVSSSIQIADDISLEHVEVVLKATHPYRGDLRIVLTSPSGTQSVLAEQRPEDSFENYNNWRFMTVRNWGESSRGQWTLQVYDAALSNTGTFDSWELILHGTTPDILVAGRGTNVTGAWKTVSLPARYQAPVVILGPPTNHDAGTGVARMQQVTPGGFQLRFQEWDYQNGTHANENIPYLALEPGRYMLSDGGIMEVGTLSLDGTGNWVPQSFTQAFAGTPKLFLTVQTFNDPQAVSVRARNVSASGFEAALFEQQSLMNGHGAETIGYLAIYSAGGSGTVPVSGRELPYLLQRVGLNQEWTPVLSSALRLEEEKSADNETAHAEEQVDVLALGDQLFAQVVSGVDLDPVALRRKPPEYSAAMEWGIVRGTTHEWTQVPLFRQYSNPVVVAKPVSANVAAPGVIQLRNVTGTSFQLRYGEWNYLDGLHAGENMFYLVVEAGTRSVAGLSVNAGKLTSNALGRGGAWETVGFTSAFGQAPAVFASVQTVNDVDVVTTRMRAVSNTGFELTMDEQERNSNGHGSETLGWIAIQQGSGATDDGRKVQVFQGLANHKATAIHYPLTVQRRYPVVVSDVMSTVEADPVFIRYLSPTKTSIKLYLQEEKSHDSELSHALEDISIFVAE